MSEKLLLEELIGRFEVITTSELSRRLGQRGISDEAARKRISRIQGNGVWRSRNLRLSHNERLISRFVNVGTDRFFQSALNILRGSRPGLVRCAEALLRDETLLIAEAGKLLAAPFDSAARAKHPSAAQELFALQELGFAERAGEHSVYDRICRPGRARESLPKAMDALGKLEVEHFMGEALATHLRQINFITWGEVRTSTKINSAPIFYNYVTTTAGFCRLAAFRREGGRDYAPVVIDVHRGTASMADLDGLIERLKRIGHSAGGPVVGVFAAENFPPDVLNSARGFGLMVVNLNQLFGEAALQLMIEVEKVLTAVRKNQASDFEKVEELLKSLKTNPFLVQLRSLAFESAAAYLLCRRGWQTVQLALDVPFQSTTRDVDVYGYQNGLRNAYLVECKAEIAGKELDPGYVTKFFTQTVPAYRRWHRENRGPLDRLVAEIWTTGEVGQAAERELASLNFQANVEPKLIGRTELQFGETDPTVLRLFEAISAAPIALAE